MPVFVAAGFSLRHAAPASVKTLQAKACGYKQSTATADLQVAP
jgi:hypothetical protein